MRSDVEPEPDEDALSPPEACPGPKENDEARLLARLRFRGFTPELYGSMVRVAEKLGIELVELDHANCSGAGVIAEHNQEMADALNARTFALAQRDRPRR